jgi:hypothetical protein
MDASRAINFDKRPMAIMTRSQVMRARALPFGQVVDDLCVEQVDEEFGVNRVLTVRPGAKLKQGARRECKRKAGMQLVYRTRWLLPTINRGCQHNLLAAMASRGFGLEKWAVGALKPPAAAYFTAKEVMYQNFRAMAALVWSHFERVYTMPCCEPLQALTNEQWLARYPPAVRRRMQDEIARANYSAKLVYSCFVKSELIPNWRKDGLRKQMDPRLISVPPSWFRLMTGPLGYYFGKRLAAAWCRHHWVVYAAGLTPETLGEVIDAFLIYGKGILVAGDDVLIYFAGRWYYFDASRFDMHVLAKIARAMRLWQLDVVGELLSGYSRHYILANTERKTYSDRYGDRLTGEGTRSSGDYDTSCGNSPIEATPAIYAITQGRPPTPEDWLAIGFVVEGGNSLHLIDMDFLSRIFIQDASGRYFAAVKAGRIISKTGWTRHIYYSTARLKAYVRGLVQGLRFDLMSNPLLTGLLQLAEKCGEGPVIIDKTAWEMDNELRCTRAHPVNEGVWDQLVQRYGCSKAMLRGAADELYALPLGGCVRHPAWKVIIDRDT